MSSNIKPSLTLNCVGFTFEKPEKHTRITDPDGVGERKKKFYRYKKRFYLEDVESIEEYIYNNFKNFSNSKLCNVILYSGDTIVAEISFRMMETLLDKFDQQRILIINN